MTASTSKSAVERRSQELDTIASVLPMERRDELAELLTDSDVESLRHLVNQGMGDNTVRALTSDLAYLEAWLKFVAQHLWVPEKRAAEPDHGMPADVVENLSRQRFLKATGPHAPAAVRRRVASWSTLTKWRGLDGTFASPALKSAIRLAVRTVPRNRRFQCAKAVAGDVLAKLLVTCAIDSLRDMREWSILMVAFASGGRRHSEVAGLRVQQLSVEAPIEVPIGPPCPLWPLILAAPKRRLAKRTRWSISPAGQSRR